MGQSFSREYGFFFPTSVCLDNNTLVPEGMRIPAISAMAWADFPTILGFMVPLARSIKPPTCSDCSGVIK